MKLQDAELICEAYVGECFHFTDMDGFLAMINGNKMIEARVPGAEKMDKDKIEATPPEGFGSISTSRTDYWKNPSKHQEQLTSTGASFGAVKIVIKTPALANIRNIKGPIKVDWRFQKNKGYIYKDINGNVVDSTDKTVDWFKQRAEQIREKKPTGVLEPWEQHIVDIATGKYGKPILRNGAGDQTRGKGWTENEDRYWIPLGSGIPLNSKFIKEIVVDPLKSFGKGGKREIQSLYDYGRRSLDLKPNSYDTKRYRYETNREQGSFDGKHKISYGSSVNPEETQEFINKYVKFYQECQNFNQQEGIIKFSPEFEKAINAFMKMHTEGTDKRVVRHQLAMQRIQNQKDEQDKKDKIKNAKYANPDWLIW